MTETDAMRFQAHMVWRSVRDHVPEHLRLLATFLFAKEDQPHRFDALFGMVRLQAAVRVAREQGAEIGGGEP